MHQAIAELTEKAITAGKRPVSIAGDCCTAIGVLAGLQRAGLNPMLIWFDAHGDFNTMETTPSGFLGGMPLAMIVGRGDLSMPVTVGLKPLPESQVILTDGRDLDPLEKDLIEMSEIIHLENPQDLLEHAVFHRDRPLYVHFDVDIVSLNESPAQNYPAAGGPSAALMHAVFRRLCQTGRIAAVSMSTWNPELDADRQSERTSMNLLETMVGKPLS